MTNVKLVLHMGDQVHSETVVQQSALDAVLFDFNPTTNAKVARIKALYAAAIQELMDIRDASNSTPAMKRMASIAITQTELTQMPAVKALFAK